MNAPRATPAIDRRARRGSAPRIAVAACAVFALVACAEPVSAPPRVGRYGSLRDLVLFELPELGAGAALFFDRFEATRGDWAAFAVTTGGLAVDAQSVPSDGDATLPVAAVSLTQARAFASWRFLRLPRFEEWQFVAVGDRRNAFPWGSKADATRANTVELGLGQPTPVGTFESGRRAGGSDQPYDLVGNVSEWTESVPVSWWEERAMYAESIVLDPISSVAACRKRVHATPALAVWLGPGCLVPSAWLLMAGGEYVPREVVGADFLSPMEGSTRDLPNRIALVESVAAGDRRSRTGVRLCATASELLASLCADTEAPTAADVVQLRRFVRRGRHRFALADAWSAMVADGHRFGDGPVATALREELGFAASAGR